MELKLRRLSRKYLLPTVSFSALLVTVVIAGLTMGSTPDKQKVLVAKTPIYEGQALNSDSVASIELPIGELGRNYLSELQAGLIATRSIAKGEILAKNLLSVNQDQRIPIRLNDLQPISSSISVGDIVDVWSSATVQGSSGVPEPVAFNAIVTSILTNSSMAQQTTCVELRISPEYLESLLTATDSNYKISLILHETLSDLG
jgi:Flp pilus assembly protein CpaB